MIALALDRLAHVVGGCENGSRVSVPGGSLTRCTSDYAECTNGATDLARQQYPDTRPHLGPFALPGTSDDNQAARARAAADNIRSMCGTPS